MNCCLKKARDLGGCGQPGGAQRVRRLRTSTMDAAHCTGGLSTGARTQEGVQRISDAIIRHGRQTKDKLAAQRHAAKVERQVWGELNRIEHQLVDAGLMPDD
jgi:hypothetical protein